MKKQLLLIALLAVSAAAMATSSGNGNDCNGNGSCSQTTNNTNTYSNTPSYNQTATGGVGYGGAATSTGISGGSFGGAGGSATGGSSTNNIGNASGFGSKSFSPEANASSNSTNLNTNTATGGSVGNISINTAPSAEQTRDASDATVQAAKLQADAIRYASEQKIYNTPSVNGPALTSSNDTCMGSSSGSVNIPGLGIGGGTTWVDNNCRMLKNSRELWNMGMKAAAMALMCTDSGNKEALELTGFKCPQSKRDEEAKEAMAKASLYNGNDPIVKARLGLIDGSGKPIVGSAGQQIKSGQ